MEPGWEGIGSNTGQWVAQKEGFSFACQRCGVVEWNSQAEEAEEFKEMLTEWYFSGDWIYRKG